jgi:NADH-quinone oxidoreductase subunit L
MAVVAWIGAATALLGATMGVTQFNLKKVLAYSTISQIGFMVLACGVGAFSVGLFHLVTHAFFKACLFLGAGAVLHALQGEEDMRNMGALARRLPFTFATFLAATLALCGIPPFAGFFSKDEILWQAWSGQGGSPWLWLVGLAASGLTAFYMFRAICLTFLGTSRVAERLRGGVHEPPPSMSIVLAVLAAGSLLAGFIGMPGVVRESFGIPAPFYSFLAPLFPAAAVEHRAASTEIALMAIALVVAVTGIVLAWRRFGRAERDPGRARAPGPAERIVSRGLVFDAVYEGVFVRFADWLSESVLGRGVETAVAKVSLGLPADAAGRTSRLLAQLQTGNVQAYVFYAVVGLAVALGWGLTRG